MLFLSYGPAKAQPVSPGHNVQPKHVSAEAATPQVQDIQACCNLKPSVFTSCKLQCRLDATVRGGYFVQEQASWYSAGSRLQQATAAPHQAHLMHRKCACGGAPTCSALVGDPPSGWQASPSGSSWLWPGDRGAETRRVPLAMVSENAALLALRIVLSAEEAACSNAPLRPLLSAAAAAAVVSPPFSLPVHVRAARLVRPQSYSLRRCSITRIEWHAVVQPCLLQEVMTRKRHCTSPKIAVRTCARGSDRHCSRSQVRRPEDLTWTPAQTASCCGLGWGRLLGPAPPTGSCHRHPNPAVHPRLMCGVSIPTPEQCARTLIQPG